MKDFNGYLNNVVLECEADLELAEAHYTAFLKALGIWDIMEDEPKRRTPARVVKAYLEFFGNNLEPLNFTTFDVPENDCDSCNIVAVRNIEFASLCAHHHLPFQGVAHVGYIPHLKVVGLSKIPRVVEHFTHGAMIQEDVCERIADFLFEELGAHGVVVVMKAEHTCLSTRGARKPGHEALTISVRGLTNGDQRLDRFLNSLT
jgi:GTP cyclohydrolase IA